MTGRILFGILQSSVPLLQREHKFVPLTLSRLLSITTCLETKTKYGTPTREIILHNEKVKQKIELKEKCCGYLEEEKPDPIYFESRNPRHLELLGFGKPVGFRSLRHTSRNFYNKLNLILSKRHTKAFVENINGEILCSASTTELYINNKLHNTSDVSAIVNIARILAVRCKEAGIERVHWKTKLDRRTEKIREFEGMMKLGGVELTEPKARVLQGPPQTLPPPRPIRRYPGPKQAGEKRRGTIKRNSKRSKRGYPDVA